MRNVWWCQVSPGPSLNLSLLNWFLQVDQELLEGRQHGSHCCRSGLDLVHQVTIVLSRLLDGGSHGKNVLPCTVAHRSGLVRRPGPVCMLEVQGVLQAQLLEDGPGGG